MLRVTRLDSDLRPVGTLSGVTDCKIDRKSTDTVPLIESCTLGCMVSVLGSAPSGWHRLEWSEGGRVHKLGTYRLTVDSSTVQQGGISVSCTGESVLAPANEETVLTGSYALAGSDAVAFVRDMLSVCPGGFSATGKAKVASTVVFDEGTTRLDAAWQVLDGIGWHLRIDGDGDVTMEPRATSFADEIDRRSNDVVDGISVKEGEVSYTRHASDALRPFDRVRLSMPRIGIEFEGYLRSQSITIGSEMASSEVIGTSERG